MDDFQTIAAAFAARIEDELRQMQARDRAGYMRAILRVIDALPFDGSPGQDQIRPVSTPKGDMGGDIDGKMTP